MANVRPERCDDVSAIHAVHEACFPTQAEAKLVDPLRAAGRLALSPVAEVDGTIVGHDVFTPVTFESGAAGMGLAPVAVGEMLRRQGVAEESSRMSLDAC